MGHELTVLYELEPKSRWHVGSGLGRGLVDRTVQMRKHRDARGLAIVPVIPGSTIKGNLRHRCEQLAAAFGLAWQDPHLASGAAVAGFHSLRQSSLIVDRLFGTRYQGSCLFVSDCLWTEGYYGPAHVQPMTRVSLDRGTGTAREARLFTADYLEPASCLQGRIEALHGDGEAKLLGTFPFEYALLLAGLVTLDRIGGHRTTGMGKVTTRITSVTYNSTRVQDTAWADCLELLELYGEGENA